jgi:hypothetical protein
MNILNRLNRDIYFNVNIRPELLKEVRVIQDNLAVITDDVLVWKAWPADRKGAAIVMLAVFRISVLLDNRHGCEGL